MKKVCVLILLACIGNVSLAQNTCNSALTIVPANSCNYSSYTTSGADFWLKFVAASKNIDISVITTPFGTNATHIHAVELISGSCGGPVIMAEDELPFVSSASKLEIDLDASNLTIGSTYFIHLLRSAPSGTCDKSTCTANNSTDPTTFQICVQNIDVIIPLDFGLEPPSRNYPYERNRGQLIDNLGNSHPEIKLYNNKVSPSIYIADNFISYAWVRGDSAAPDSVHRVDMTLVGGNSGTKVFKTELAPGLSNYFRNNVSKGVVDNKAYYRAVINNVYPLIDMQWYSNIVGEKFYFIVHPSGDPNNIVLKFDGATSVTALQNGGLKITTPMGGITYEAPHAYMVNPGGNVVPMPWQCKFVQVTSNTVKFDTRNIPDNMPLFIQIDRGHNLSSLPVSPCDWSTFYGGSGWDNTHGVITDASGNSFMVGETDSPNFPNLVGGFVTNNGGVRNAFIVKLTPNGGPVWGTFYGGSSSSCEGHAVAINSNGEVYLCGNTGDTDLPIVPAGSSSSFGGYDAYIAKFNSSGNSLLFSRYYGTSSTDNATSLAVDASNNVFMVGNTQGSTSGLPLANGGIYNQTTGGGGFTDGYVAKFSSSNSLLWGTYFGGPDVETINSIVIKPNGNILMSGFTGSSTRASSNVTNPICGVPTAGYFPDCTGGGSFYGQLFGGGFQDNFITEFDPSGTMVWSTYYGGLGSESDAFIVLNPLNPNTEFFLVGNAQKDSWPISMGGPYLQNQPVAGGRGFVAKFVNRQPTWYTFVGDGDNVFLTAGVCSNNGVLYVTGRVVTTGYTTGSMCQPSPISGPSPLMEKCFPAGIFNQPTYGGTNASSSGDAYIMAFNTANQLIWSTFYGGGSLDEARGLAFDAVNNKIVFTGITQSGTLPLADPSIGNYQQNTNAGSSTSILNPTSNRDAFFAKFCVSNIVGIKENSFTDKISVSAYPNPNNGDFYVMLNYLSANCSYQLYDAMGRIIEAGRKEISDAKIQFNFSDKKLTSGMYFLKLNYKDQQTTVKLMVD